jgi:hypothetical protein
MHFKSIVHACMNKDEHGFFPIHTMKKKKEKKRNNYQMLANKENKNREKESTTYDISQSDI